MSVAERTLPADPGSVAAARGFLTEQLHAWHVEPLEWVAAQVVSELATNAVIHAGTAFTVVLTLADGELRVEVRDGSRRIPRQRHYGVSATTGRGLALVGALSQEWGIERGDDGKTVWCTFSPDADEVEVDLDAFLTDEDLAELGLPPQGLTS